MPCVPTGIRRLATSFTGRWLGATSSAAQICELASAKISGMAFANRCSVLMTVSLDGVPFRQPLRTTQQQDPGSIGSSCSAPDLTLFGQCPNRLLDAAELTIRTQHLVDAKPHHGLLRADRLQAGDGKIDAIGVTFADQVPQDFRPREVDFDDPPRFPYKQPRLLRRGLPGVQDVAPEIIGVEKRQRRLKSRDDDTRLLFARKIWARRPPDRGSGHAF